MKRTFWIIMVAVVLAAVVTCPDEQAHKNTLKSTINAALNEEIDQACGNENGGLAVLASAIGSAFGGWAVDVFVDNRVFVKNYFACSIGYATWEGETNIVSVGCFGHIFCTDKENILEAIDKEKTR